MINLYKEKIKNDDDQLNLLKNMNLKKLKPYMKCRFICAGRGGPSSLGTGLEIDMTIYVDAYHDQK